MAMAEGESIADVLANLGDGIDDDSIFQELEQQENEAKYVDDDNDMLSLEDENDPVDYTHRLDDYMMMLQEASAKLSMIDGGYKGKLAAYMARRNEESELYREITAIQNVGANCNMQEVNKRTSRMSWLGSTGIYGPAWRRMMQRRPKIRIRGLTEEEARRVHKNRSDRALWNKILLGIEEEKPEQEIPLSQSELEDLAKKHFKEGNFHLLRKIPSKWHKELSLNRWSRGIFFPWDLDKPGTEFPYRPAIDLKVRPSSNLIKDHVPYSRYNPYDITTNHFTHKSGAHEIQDAFTAHWRQKCLERADKALAAAKVLKEEKRVVAEMLAKVEEKQKKKNMKQNKVVQSKSVVSGQITQLDSSYVTEEPEENTALDLTHTIEDGQGSFEEMPSAATVHASEQTKQKSKNKSIFNKMPWSKEKEEVSVHGDKALVPLDKEGSHVDSQTLGSALHSHAGDSAGEDAEEMVEPSRLVEEPKPGGGGQEKEDTGEVQEGAAEGGLGGQKGSESGSRLTPHGMNRKYKDTPRREESPFWKTQHPGEAKGKLKSEAARRQMQKQGSFLRRLSSMFSRSGSEKIVPDKKNTEETDNPKLKGFTKSNSNGNISRQVSGISFEAGTSAGDSSPNKSKKKTATKVVGRRFESSASTVAANTSNTPMGLATKKKKKGPPPKRRKKKKSDEDTLPVVDTNQEYVPKTVWEKAKHKFTSSKNAYVEQFKIGQKQDEYKTNLFSAPPSAADKRLVETLCTVRALKRGTARRLRILLKIFTLGIFGADPERNLYTPNDLKQAALYGHYNKVVDILDHWSEITPNSRCEEEGDTPFMAAVIRALEGEALEDEDFTMAVGIAGMLKKIGKWFRRKKRNGGKLDLCVKILTHRGGDVNVVKIDKGEGDGYALIHTAAERNIVDLAKWLHARDVNVHSLSSVLSRTALMVAARKGHGDMVHRLLHMGAIDTINHQDSQGWTALHLVAAYCEPEYVEMMLICGADPTLRHNGNRLPIEEAQMRNRTEHAQVIMAYKDRSRAYRHQISYLNDEVRLGRNSQDDASVSVGGSIASGLRSLRGELVRGISTLSGAANP